jgi:hypothetical protein
MHQRHVELGADIAIGIVVMMRLNGEPGGADHCVLNGVEAGVIQLVKILERTAGKGGSAEKGGHSRDVAETSAHAL